MAFPQIHQDVKSLSQLGNLSDRDLVWLKLEMLHRLQNFQNLNRGRYEQLLAEIDQQLHLRHEDEVPL